MSLGWCCGGLSAVQGIVVLGFELLILSMVVLVGCYIRGCSLVGVLRTSLRLLGSNCSNV